MGVAARWMAWQQRGAGTTSPSSGTGEADAPVTSVSAPVMVEAYINSLWTDITSMVYDRDKVTVTRGQSREGSSVERSTGRMTLNNRNGQFTPRNPTGPYYGYIGRNTSLRVSVPYGETYLSLDGTTGSEATCPDSANVSITGDTDIRIDLSLTSWRTAQGLCGKYQISGNQRSWAFFLNANGTLAFWNSPDGTSASLLTATSTAAVSIPGDRRQALRVTIDVNDPSNATAVTFYYSDTISGSWTQLGDQVIASNTPTSIFDSTAVVEVGAITDLVTTGVPVTGKVHAFQLLAGLLSSDARANPDFSIQAPNVGAFLDTATIQNLWTITGSAVLTDRDYRLHGEVSEWPQRWDISGSDVYTPIEASGILRRLTQGDSPLYSTLRRGLVTVSSDPPAAYWPCEDASGATSLASGLTGGTPMTIAGGSDLAADSTTFVASDALPRVNNAIWTGSVPAYTATGESSTRWLMAIPAAGATNNSIAIRVLTTGNAPRWEVAYTTASSGTLTVNAYAADGTNLLTSSLGGGYNGLAMRLSLSLTQVGSDIQWSLMTIEPGSVSAVGSGGTLAGRTAGNVRKVVVDPSPNSMGDTVYGHIAVHTSTATDLIELADELAAYVGETAGRRIERLCTEEGIAFRHGGDLDDTVAMGTQGIASLVALLTEAATADGGMLYEPREVFGLGYRPRTSLYNQDACATLDYSAGELFVGLDPTDDDQNTINDVTASRTGGSSARYELTEGALSILDPPDGVGRYDTAITINVQTDSQLADQAAWRVHLGTVDEERYPQVTVALANPRIAADTALAAAVRAVDMGDRITITNPPAWLPPGDVDQLALGTSEMISGFEHTVTFNCAPASPWSIAIADDDVLGRADTDGSELAADAGPAATSLSVSVTSGPLWTTSAPEFPFDVTVGGEVMTVSAISGAASPQTFTVTRSVNGVVKTQLAGTDVRLTHPAIVAL